MSVITWSARPSAGSNASAAAGDIRDMKVDIATGLGQSFYWPGSAGSQGASAESSGALQAGTMRPAVASPTGEPDGSLMIFYSRPGVFHAGSSGSYYLGGRRTLLAASPQGSGDVITHWVIDQSVTTFALSATEADNSFATVSLFNTAFGAVPNVQATIELDDDMGSSIAAFFGCSHLETSRCSSALSILGNPGPSIATMHISSMGTVEF